MLPSPESPPLHAGVVAAQCSTLSRPLLAEVAQAGAGAFKVLAALPRVLYLAPIDHPAHPSGNPSGRPRGPHQVLPVETSDAIGLPTAVRLPLPSRQVRWGVATGDEVALSADLLRLPGWSIGVHDTWQPQPVRTNPKRPSAHALEVAQQRLPAGPLPVLDATLIGRGRGLTPSGDDSLCGALLMLRALEATPEHTALWAAVEPRLGTTTSLSASLLTGAADGYAVPAVSRLIEALAADDAPATIRHLPAVLALGNSSGLDLVRGALAAGLQVVADDPQGG